MKLKNNMFVTISALSLAASVAGCAASSPAAVKALGQTSTASGQVGAALGEDCKPKFTQIYLPPTKVGGTGRTIQVPTGPACDNKKTPAAQVGSANLLQAQITSEVPGSVASVYSTKLKKLPELCVTPCTLSLDRNLKWRATVLMSDGSNHTIPIPFHAYEKKGVAVKFSPKNPLEITVRSLEAGAFDPVAAITDRDVQPLVRIPVPGPMNVKKSGRCRLRFNVSPRGVPSDITVMSCSDSLYLTHAIENINKQTYASRTNPVWVTGVEQSVVFKLLDENGKVYPE